MEIREFCEQVLLGGTLGAKLQPPAEPLTDADPEFRGILPPMPARPELLSMSRDHRVKVHFPKIAHMKEASARGRVFHFFANHELLALELMALALLKFPRSPAGFRYGIVRTMVEEQQHMGLYLQRMEDLGVSFGDLPLNNFFWHCLKDMASPLEYAAGMSLTFEQANLDYCLYYQEIFAALDDAPSAAILERVYREEIGHVKHGVHWFDQWRDPGLSRFQAYEHCLKLPLNPMRGKGLAFAVEGRRLAGLDDAFIEAMRRYQRSHNRSGSLYVFNPDCEHVVREGAGYTPAARTKKLQADLAPLMMVFGNAMDKVVCPRVPAPSFVAELVALGFDPPQFVAPDDPARLQGMCSVRPWGMTPHYKGEGLKSEEIAGWYDKGQLIALRQELRLKFPQLYRFPAAWDGGVCCNPEEGEAYVRRYFADFGLSTVFKPVFGAAGQGQVRVRGGQVTEEHRAWLKNQCAHPGYVLVEPWFEERTMDISLILQVGEDETSTTVMRALVDDRGQYRGHFLGPLSRSLPKELRRAWGQEGTGAAFEEFGAASGAWLRSRGFRGACGADAYAFRYGDELYVQPLSEINPRFTMGHVAKRLRAHVAAGVDALFLLIGRRDLSLLGVKQFSELKQVWHNHAFEVREGRLMAGVGFLTDPAAAEEIAASLWVGEAAIRIALTLLPSASQKISLKGEA